MAELKIRRINAELQKIANEELNELPERVGADIEALRTWIKQQPHLRARDDDQFLLSFLRGCKFSLEKAKSKIDKFYTLRTKYPDFFGAFDADEATIRAIINAGWEIKRFNCIWFKKIIHIYAWIYVLNSIILLLPKPLHEHGARIILIRQGALPADKYTIEHFIRAVSHLQEIIIREDDHAIISGVISIIDIEDCTTAHVMQMTPSVMKKMSVHAEEAVPLRPQQQHFIHIPSGFETVFNAMRPLMTKKQQNRVSF